ncbi:unnamed protein product [Adineta ricciae]|uniref:DED domain-containing protein n=1 Tax=Adineta ricciae TaxID=249248 RepID=A0A814X5L2_ADIRI|nr:unnamed protein product [Adineta ricciae]CAF1339048.1 unnamed protein product [Adineta ricciae]
MNDHDLRAVILKVEQRLSVDDRHRLHFFLYNDVPKKYGDDLSLYGTLSIIQSLFEQDKINSNDFTFLIKTFYEIQCYDAVKLLTEHMKELQPNGLNESMRSLSIIMPPVIEQLVDDNDGIYSIDTALPQENICENNNIEMNIIDDGRKRTCKLKEQNQSLKILSMTRKCSLVFILLSIILGILLIGCCVWIIILNMKYQHILKEKTMNEEKIDDLNTLQSKNQQKIDYFNKTLSDLRDNLKIGITVAGGHGSGTATNQLNTPRGLFIDENRTMFIADEKNHRIVQWKLGDENGTVVAGGNGKGKQLDQFDSPTSVVIDSVTNSLIICDSKNRRVIQWYHRNGTKEGTIYINNIGCADMTIDNDGGLYIIDLDKHEVRRYEMKGTIVTSVAGGHGEGSNLNQLRFPSFIFVDQQHNVYVADNANHRISKWNKGATEGIIIAGYGGCGDDFDQLCNPNGLFVDTNGTLYVADDSNNRVMRWLQGEQRGAVVVGGHGRGFTSRHFDGLNDLVFDHHGELYVIDRGNNRIQNFVIR